MNAGGREVPEPLRALNRGAPASPPAGVAAGAMLGVLGGGQLGRMFVHAAQQCGYLTTVLDPDATSPAGGIAHRHMQADYLGVDGLAQMAQTCAAVTIEFENVPAAALEQLALRCIVAPGADSVRVCQDRVLEKACFTECDVPCAPHAVIDSQVALEACNAGLLPGILKTARLGYDGKGQVRVATANALAAAWQALGRVPCVLEQQLPLAFEVSVVVARGRDGTTVHFPVQQNLHRDGILAVTQAPAPDLPQPLQRAAVDAATRIAGRLGHVGVLCVEFFVLQDGSLIANEMAPRPHNSAHHTIDACDLSQFDLQLRTLVGAPMVTPRQHSAAVMLNLLGDLWFRSGADPCEPRWFDVLALRGAHLHLYGKASARPGRKMGHLTITAPDPGAALDVARQAAALLGMAPF